MKYDIKIPAVGESVTEAMVSQWMKKNGEAVQVNDVLLLLETDKASVDVVAEYAGVLEILVQEKQTVPIGTVVARIDSEGVAQTASPSAQTSPTTAPPVATVAAAAPMASSTSSSDKEVFLSPSVKKLVEENNLNPKDIPATGPKQNLLKGDVVQFMESAKSQPLTISKPASDKSTGQSPLQIQRSEGSRGDLTRRVPMSMIRRKIAERLVHAQSTAAILTTFNEIDMSAAMAMRSKYKDSFKERHGVGLGFMSFFVKAVVEALKAVPEVNASIDGTDFIYHDNYHIGIAVGTERGLIVPVIRNVDQLSMAGIELAIRDYAQKARDGKISVDDLSGGTFTISNGGVYGSLMSTPILNPPQSGILGMHKIEERPVAIAGQVVIRPMMYVALSYDHRLIDGSQSVGFLVKVKEGLEDPSRLLLGV